jgi:FMN reductase
MCATRSICVAGISGNLRRRSRTKALVEHLDRKATRDRNVTFALYDLIDTGPGLGAEFARETRSSRAAAIVNAIEAADALVVATRVFKGSYNGLFKHLFDFVEPAKLANKPIVLAAAGRGRKHALMVEHQLHPLFGFFTVLKSATAAYAGDQDFVEYRLVNSAVIVRAADAASQHNVAIGSRPANLRGRTKGMDGPGISSYGVVADTAVLRQSSHGGVS